MTVKSEMVYCRLLSLGGKAELIVMGYACLWQNAPAQILVRLSGLTHITAPLRTKQKYVYREMKLRVDKITRYTRKSDLYTILYQRLTKALLKGFAVSKSICYFQFMNLYYNPSYALSPFITSEYFPLRIIRTTSFKQLLFNFPVTSVTPQYITTH